MSNLAGGLRSGYNLKEIQHRFLSRLSQRSASLHCHKASWELVKVFHTTHRRHLCCPLFAACLLYRIWNLMFIKSKLQLYGVSLQLYCVSLQLYCVSLQLYGVSLTLYGVSLQLDGVSLQLYGVSLQLYGVSLQLHGVSLKLNGVFLQLHGVSLQ